MTNCPLKAFQLHYCPNNDAESMVKHLIFLQIFAVVSIMSEILLLTWPLELDLSVIVCPILSRVRLTRLGSGAWHQARMLGLP